MSMRLVFPQWRAGHHSNFSPLPLLPIGFKLDRLPICIVVMEVYFEGRDAAEWFKYMACRLSGLFLKHPWEAGRAKRV